MKNVKKLITFSMLLLMSLLVSSNLVAQCAPNTEAYGNAVAPLAGDPPVTIAPDVWQSNYSTITGIVNGSSYTVNINCGGVITVRSGSPSGPVVAFGPAPLTFTATSAGTYYIHFNTTGCGTANSNCLATIAPGSILDPGTPQDCKGAILVCSNSSFSGNASGYGVGNELTATNRGCMGIEHQSSWYYLHVGTGGVLDMAIVPNGASDDYDWAIWGPFTAATAAANCSPTTAPIRCSFSDKFHSHITGMKTVSPAENSEGVNGDGWVSPLNVTAGQVYILLIDNFLVSSEAFNLNWTGSTAVLSCAPVVLSVTISSFTGKKEASTNVLSWTTTSEKNNDYFILEHSIDGVTWEVVSKDQGAGNSNQTRNYNFVHRDFAKTNNYYRLTQVDFDGAKLIYGVVLIDNSLDKVVVRTINTLGQDVDENYKGLVIEYYDDNTFSKRIQ